MGKIIKCDKKTWRDFQEVYNYLFYQQKHIIDAEIGKPFPGDINKLIQSCDKASKLLLTIKIKSEMLNK